MFSILRSLPPPTKSNCCCCTLPLFPVSFLYLLTQLLCHPKVSFKFHCLDYKSFYIDYFRLLGNDSLQDGEVIWTKTLVHYSTYRVKDILPVVKEIAAIMINAEKCKYQAVRRKYTNSKHMKISLRPELKSPTLQALANHRTE